MYNQNGHHNAVGQLLHWTMTGQSHWGSPFVEVLRCYDTPLRGQFSQKKKKLHFSFHPLWWSVASRPRRLSQWEPLAGRHSKKLFTVRTKIIISILSDLVSPFFYFCFLLHFLLLCKSDCKCYMTAARSMQHSNSIIPVFHDITLSVWCRLNLMYCGNVHKLFSLIGN